MSQVESLSGAYAAAIGWIERFATSRRWRWKLVVVLALTTVCLSFNPRFSARLLGRPEAHPQKWGVLEQQSRTLLMQPAPGDPASNEAKSTFRLTVPLIMKILHLERDGVLVLEVFTSLLFFYFTILLVERTTGDAVIACLAAAGVASIYTGIAGFTDQSGWFDVFAYLFLLLAMFVPNVVAILVFVLLASWTDERGFVACMFVFAWWKLKELKSSELTVWSVFKPGLRSGAVVAGMLLYLAGRYLISTLTGLHTPHEATGLEQLLKSTNDMGLAAWGALEGFWLPVLFALGHLFSRKQRFAPLLLMGMMTVMLLMALSVQDITRSAGYMFPVIFISLLVLSEDMHKSELRILFAAAAVVSFLFPAYCVVTAWNPSVAWYKPVFIKLIDEVRLRLYGH